MAYLLSNLLRDALDDGLGQMIFFRATGGSTSTAQDSNANGRYGDDADALRDGTLFVAKDAGGLSAAPENEFQRISDYDGTTITVDTVLTAAVASGDIIGIAQPSFPFLKCIESANRAVQSFGRIPLVDITTITPVADQSEYTWAIAWKYSPPFRIDVQGRTNGTNDNQWYTLADSEFEVQPAVPGTAGKIIFFKYLPVGHSVRVWYWGIHPNMSVYSDNVSETIHPTLAKAALTEILAGWYYKQSGGIEPAWREIWNEAKNKLQEAKEMHPIWSPDDQPRTFGSLGNQQAAGDFPPSPISWTR